MAVSVNRIKTRVASEKEVIKTSARCRTFAFYDKFIKTKSSKCYIFQYNIYMLYFSITFINLNKLSRVYNSFSSFKF